MLARAQGLWEITHRIKFGPQSVAEGTHSASLIRDLQSELSGSEGTLAGRLAIPLVHTSLGVAGMLSLRGAWAVLHVKKLLCPLLWADGEVHDLRCLVLWVGGSSSYMQGPQGLWEPPASPPPGSLSHHTVSGWNNT